MAILGLCCAGFFSRAFFLVAVHELLIVVASLAAECGL